MTFAVPMLPAGALRQSRTSSTSVDPPASPSMHPGTTPASAKVMDKCKNRKTEFSIAVANLESSSTEKIAVIKEFAQKYTTSQRIFMPLPWPVTSQSYSMSFPKRWRLLMRTVNFFVLILDTRPTVVRRLMQRKMLHTTSAKGTRQSGDSVTLYINVGYAVSIVIDVLIVIDIVTAYLLILPGTFMS